MKVTYFRKQMKVHFPDGSFAFCYIYTRSTSYNTIKILLYEQGFNDFTYFEELSLERITVTVPYKELEKLNHEQNKKENKPWNK